MMQAPTTPTERDLRWFGVLGTVFACGTAAWLTRPNSAGMTVAGIVAFPGVILGLVGLTRPQWLRALYVGWMRVVSPIAWLAGHFLLGIVYFGVVMPIGWMLKTCGHDPLQRRADPTATTYWQPRTRQRQSSNYFRRF